MTEKPTRHELESYRKVYEFSQKLLSQYDLPTILQTMVDSIVEITGADMGILFLVDEKTPHVEVARTAQHDTIDDAEGYFSESVLYKVIETNSPLIANDAINHPALSKSRSIFELSIRSVMCVPMFDHGALMGLIYVCNTTHIGSFTPLHLELLTIFGLQASLLIADAMRVEALTQSEERHRSLVELSPETIAVISERRLLFVNSAGVRLIGASGPESIVGRFLDEFLVARDPEQKGPFWYDSQDWLGEAIEDRLVRQDGEIIDVEIVGTQVVFAGQPAVQVVIRDTTAQRQLMAARMRLDRLVAMGTLAAGVGHEINNPLSYVHANLDFAKEEVFTSVSELRKLEGQLQDQGASSLAESTLHTLANRLDDAHHGLRAANDGIGRIRDIVQGIQGFSRLGAEDDAAVFVEKPLVFSLDMAQNEIRYRAQVHREIEATPPVMANESRLGQVFLNLLINAAHAIPAGHPNKNEIAIRVFAAQDNVVVEIKDTGIGIPARSLEHIFEPFVTTKPKGEGTGLGLPICRDIVEEFGGRIEVESEVGVGSCFRVVLPAAKESRRRPSMESVVPWAGKRGHLLVVDDEIHIGTSLRRLLAAEHDVIVATGAEEALEILAQDETYDVVLCDLMMPGFGGIEFFTALSARNSTYVNKVIFMTAGVLTSGEHKFLQTHSCPWVSKPFDIAALRAQIARRVRMRS